MNNASKNSSQDNIKDVAENEINEMEIQTILLNLQQSIFEVPDYLANNQCHSRL